MRSALPASIACAIALCACTGTIGNADGQRSPGGEHGGEPGSGGASNGAGSGVYGGSAGVDTSPLTPFVAYESVARRMSQAELDRTLRDVFGDSTEPASKFLPEDEFRPYDNDYTVQQAS